MPVPGYHSKFQCFQVFLKLWYIRNNRPIIGYRPDIIAFFQLMSIVMGFINNDIFQCENYYLSKQNLNLSNCLYHILHFSLKINELQYNNICNMAHSILVSKTNFEYQKIEVGYFIIIILIY